VLAVVDDEDGYGYDVVRRLRAGGLDDVGDASVSPPLIEVPARPVTASGQARPRFGERPRR
jgi:hypothetical protein